MHSRYSRILILAVPALLLSVRPGVAQQQIFPASNDVAYTVPAGTILRVTLSSRLNLSHLQSGNQVEGELERPVYVYDREVIPARTHIHAVVGEVDKHKVEQKKGFLEHLQAIRSFGLNRKYEYGVTFESAQLTPPDGSPQPLDIKFVQAGEVVELHTKGDQVEVGGGTAGDYAKHAPGVGTISSIKHGKKQAQQYRHPEVTLETEQPISFLLPAGPSTATPGQVSVIPSGTHARLLLLEPLSASDSKQGDIFHARVLQPIIENGRLVVPEGSTLVGHIGKVVAPRRLNRAGSVYLAFDKLVLPNGAAQSVAASLVGTAMDKKQAGKMDEEGGLHGQGPGAKKMLKDFGVGLASQQVADEVAEMAAHAAGPYVSIPMGLFMFLGGHGHDVELPRFSELQVVFGRPMPIGHDQVVPTQPDVSQPNQLPQR